MWTEESRDDTPRRRVKGTRDAVETAIDMAKEDKSSTWESHLSKVPDRVARWQEKSSSAPSRQASE